MNDKSHLSEHWVTHQNILLYMGPGAVQMNIDMEIPFVHLLAFSIGNQARSRFVAALGRSNLERNKTIRTKVGPVLVPQKPRRRQVGCTIRL
jgi:hypothetical protein